MKAASKRVDRGRNQRIALGVGRWFHSVNDDGAIIWQGKILRDSRSGVFVVQLYSWLDGRPTDQRIVRASEMVGWRFYRTDAEMRAVGDRLFERR